MKPLFAITLAVALTCASNADAQTYPSRPITIVVPFAAGGTTDVLSRMIAQHLRVSLGQPVIIENVTGANGSIGAGRVARAAPDGYTLVDGAWNTHVANGALYPLQYDVSKDFEPIAPIARTRFLIAANKAVSAPDLSGLIAWLKANPGMATAGTLGVGSAQHVGGILFQKMTSTRFAFVPYRGAAPAVQDLVAGHIDWMMAGPADALPHWRAGTIKAYAVMANTRLASASEIPTVDEAGLPGFYLANWFAIWAPKGTPQSVVAKLSSAITDALADPRLSARLADLGFEIFPRDQQTPEALAALQKAEIEKWWPIIKAAGIKGE